MTKLNILHETPENLDKYISRYYNTGEIYYLSMQEIGRKFICSYLGLNEDEIFERLRDAYIENTGISNLEVSDNERMFFKNITKSFIFIEKDPSKIVIEHLQNASAHLKEIDERISDIEKELIKIKTSNITSEIQEKPPVLTYFLSLNKHAREQIVEFLKEGIYSYSLADAGTFSNMKFSFRYPYPYAVKPESYQVKYPTLISNKFGDLVTKKYRELQKLFQKNSVAFNEFLSDYIADQNVVEQLQMECVNNHFFRSRSGIILEAIRAYEDGRSALFSSIAMTIIEGVFHDICIALGNLENDVLTLGFQAKINIMNEKLDYHFDYKYYAFKFRLLRNKVAHGLMNSTEASEISGLALLDIWDAAKISRSMEIPTNQKLFFMHQVAKEGTNGDFKYLAALVFCQKISVPADSYSDSDIKNIHKLLLSNEYWAYIDLKIGETPESKSYANALLKAMYANNNEYSCLDLKNKCKERFKNTFKDLPKFEPSKFIGSLIRYTPRD
ncbi:MULTISPECIES: hypothetical protein [Sphingobacterium]|uniref:hypothetical protein n=1 Tax=Sphingobacterium TaxID=28453 RepID=UPI00257FF3BC|nr:MULTISPECIES: hypothetical protein [Sphingobacterium]